MNPSKQTLAWVGGIILFLTIFGITLWNGKVKDIKQPDPLAGIEQFESPKEEDKAVALSYLDAVIKQAYAQGSNEALKKVLSFTQTEAKDGQPSQPICLNAEGKPQTVQIGDVQFYNVACLKKAEPAPVVAPVVPVVPVEPQN